MSNETTLHEALRTPPEVVTPGGGAIQVRKLRLRDVQPVMAAYEGFLALIASVLGREPTEDEIREKMPWVLSEAFGGGEESDTWKILGALTDLTPDAAGEMGLDDLALLWAGIYEANQVPFGNHQKMLRNFLRAVVAAAESPTPTSPSPSAEPASTPETSS